MGILSWASWLFTTPRRPLTMCSACPGPDTGPRSTHSHISKYLLNAYRTLLDVLVQRVNRGEVWHHDAHSIALHKSALTLALSLASPVTLRSVKSQKPALCPQPGLLRNLEWGNSEPQCSRAKLWQKESLLTNLSHVDIPPSRRGYMRSIPVSVCKKEKLIGSA